MNASQNKVMHALLSATGLMGEKANLVFGFTSGRSESSRDMNDAEAREMILYIKTQQAKQEAPANKMRRRIISMAHEMHWHSLGQAPGDSPKIDMARLDGWCRKYGYLHKKLNDYTYLELPKLVTQFKGVYDDFIKKI
jgi:hypothetical protein